MTDVAPAAKGWRASLHHRVRATPQWLLRLTNTVTVAGVAFGLAGLATFLLVTSSVQRAMDSTAQLIRVQQIETNLLRADANATNAFLVAGAEATNQRLAYDQAIDATNSLIVTAAEAEPADQAALEALNKALSSYVETIELARANNRQGFPIGAEYLKRAGTILRGDVLPILNSLVSTNAKRAESQLHEQVAVVFVFVGVASLLSLVWVQIRIARRFKRRINVPLAGATALGIIALLAGLIGLGVTAKVIGDIREGSFTDVRDAATARIEGNNAKSNESLTLIARGSGGGFEQAWQDSAKIVNQRLSRLPDVQSTWQTYVATHGDLRRIDQNGDWDGAVRIATSRSNSTFTNFDTEVTAVVDQAGAATTEDLGTVITGLGFGAMTTLLAGLAMASLARRGVGQRLREYR